MRGIDQSEYLRGFHYLPVPVACLGYARLVSALDLVFVFHVLMLFGLIYVYYHFIYFTPYFCTSSFPFQSSVCSRVSLLLVKLNPAVWVGPGAMVLRQRWLEVQKAFIPITSVDAWS